MNTEARILDRIVQDWWLGNRTEEVFQQILERTLTAEPASLLPFARAIQILVKKQLPPAMTRRVEQFRARMMGLRDRELQIDQLGDIDNEPGTLLSVLNEDVAELRGFAPESLRNAKLAHQESRSAAARALLETLGWGQLPATTATELQLAISDLAEREEYEAWGLFVDRNAGEGVALGIKLVELDSGQQLLSLSDQELTEQARIALRLGLDGHGWEAKIEWPARFVGESIGLPLYVAALVARRQLPRHALTASTGSLEIDGRVIGVTGIRAKLEAARLIGIRRILLPTENLEEATTTAGDDLVIVPVGNVQEVLGALRQSISSVELGYSELIRVVRACLRGYNLLLADESENTTGHRLMVANPQGKASIWIYRNGRVRADGPPGPVLEAANRLIKDIVPPDPIQRANHSFNLPTPGLQDRYLGVLKELGAVGEAAHDYETWRVRLARGRSRSTIVLYASGKCVIQGTAPAWDDALRAAEQTTEPIGGLPAPKESASAHPAAVTALDEDAAPHIGTDEAGKGDYFGPLVTAAVYVDQELLPHFRALGVRDSKQLKDKRVREIATEIRRLADGKYAVTPINPRKYNELMEQFRRERKNLNSLLAWAHARSIDRLLSAPASRGIRATFVVVDQFGDERYIEERTKRAGIPIRQRHKAEADIAVAAASILARDGFLQWMERWSDRTKVPLPKGASPHVIEAGKQFVRRWGAKWLGDVAKLSFRTTKQVLEGEDENESSPPPPWADEAADAARES